jgi:hypothetical protein
MKKCGLVLAACLSTAAVCLSLPQQAVARPAYMTAFKEKYPELSEKVAEAKCGVCHGEGGKNKKVVSDYGKALAGVLGAKNVKDAEKIAGALSKIESKDSGNGKTYGDILKGGDLPPAAK